MSLRRAQVSQTWASRPLSMKPFAIFTTACRQKSAAPRWWSLREHWLSKSPTTATPRRGCCWMTCVQRACRSWAWPSQRHRRTWTRITRKRWKPTSSEVLNWNYWLPTWLTLTSTCSVRHCKQSVTSSSPTSACRPCTTATLFTVTKCASSYRRSSLCASRWVSPPAKTTRTPGPSSFTDCCRASTTWAQRPRCLTQARCDRSSVRVTWRQCRMISLASTARFRTTPCCLSSPAAWVTTGHPCAHWAPTSRAPMARARASCLSWRSSTTLLWRLIRAASAKAPSVPTSKHGTWTLKSFWICARTRATTAAERMTWTPPTGFRTSLWSGCSKTVTGRCSHPTTCRICTTCMAKRSKSVMSSTRKWRAPASWSCTRHSKLKIFGERCWAWFLKPAIPGWPSRIHAICARPSSIAAWCTPPTFVRKSRSTRMRKKLPYATWVQSTCPST